MAMIRFDSIRFDSIHFILACFCNTNGFGKMMKFRADASRSVEHRQRGGHACYFARRLAKSDLGGDMPVRQSALASVLLLCSVVLVAASY